MPSRLLLDEHMPVRVGHVLSAKGHDVAFARGLSMSASGDRIGDEFVLQEAAKQKRAVVTLDQQDFVRLHREPRGHYGILICKDLISIHRDAANEVLAKLLDQFLRGAGALAGQLFVMRKTPKGLEFLQWSEPDDDASDP